MNSIHSALRTGPFLALVTLVLACSVPVGALPSTTASSPPQPSPSTVDGCIVFSVEAGQAADDVNSLRRDATSVIVGVFGGYGPAMWNTPDGHRPTRAEFQSAPASLVRPIQIDVKGELKGARAVAERAVQRGGERGCDQITYDGDPVLEDGRRYVFFLVPLADNVGAQLEQQLVLAVWPVGPDDRVDTAKDGKLTLAELKDAIDNGKPETTPNPNEPSGPPQG